MYLFSHISFVDIFAILHISPSIAANYEAVELEKAKLRIATERQLVLEKEAQTEQLRAQIEARKG